MSAHPTTPHNRKRVTVNTQSFLQQFCLCLARVFGKMATTSNVLRIDLTLDENKLEEGALKLFETVKPGWNQKDIKFKVTRC